MKGGRRGVTRAARRGKCTMGLFQFHFKAAWEASSRTALPRAVAMPEFPTFLPSPIHHPLPLPPRCAALAFVPRCVAICSYCFRPREAALSRSAKAPHSLPSPHAQMQHFKKGGEEKEGKKATEENPEPLTMRLSKCTGRQPTPPPVSASPPTHHTPTPHLNPNRDPLPLILTHSAVR